MDGSFRGSLGDNSRRMCKNLKAVGAGDGGPIAMAAKLSLRPGCN